MTTQKQRQTIATEAKSGSITAFMQRHYRHFNAAVVVDAADAYRAHLNSGGKMFLAMGGAMSTAELGVSLAEMIRQGKVHAISCTGANLEEDLFNLVAHDEYFRIPGYRELSRQEEQDLKNRGLNRVTDTCIPEESAMRVVERPLLDLWKRACADGQSFFPYEYLYQLIESGVLRKHYQIDAKDSWVIAACQKNLPIFTPGWEDSTLGNYFVSCVVRKLLPSFDLVKSGFHQMASLIDWYRATSSNSSIGFFQIAGGIAGDFPVCVVPLMKKDLEEDCRTWGYFCQISDSTTSYGSYSGAVPNEKITWGKIDMDAQTFVIESDATIVAPLVFAYVLGM